VLAHALILPSRGRLPVPSSLVGAPVPQRVGPRRSQSGACATISAFYTVSAKPGHMMWPQTLLWWGRGVADVPDFGVYPLCALRHPRGGWLVSTRGIPVKETPPSQTPPSTDPYTFDPFAQHPFYARINYSLVQRALVRLDAARPHGASVRIVDLASGTGAVTQLIVDELARLGRPATVLGIEPAGDALAIARERLQGRAVRFVQGDADQLAHVVTDADMVFLCNTLHLMPEKSAVVRTIASVLAPGGFLACNSTFFTGAQTPESERFTHRWIRRAFGWLRQHHPDLHPTHRGQAAALSWLSADEYVALLETHRFQLVERTLELALLPLQAVQDIGHYRLFIAGALPGIPIPIGAEALAWAASVAAQELAITEVPRIWLQLLARAPARR
jgi:ubiquinone/menaquinone biosynthesis C-methylase UbiE